MTADPLWSFLARFHGLHSDMERTSLWADLGSSAPVDDPRALARGEFTLPGPVEFRRDTGSRRVDWVGTTLVALRLVSDRFVERVTAGGFTGLAPYEVELVDHDGSPIEGYHGLAVVGRCGPVDYSLCRTEQVEGQPSPIYRGLPFEPAGWDGSDVFMSPNTSHVFVTGEVLEALDGLTGFYARSVADCEVPMTEGMARKYGLPT